MKVFGIIGMLLSMAIMGYLTMKRVAPNRAQNVDQSVEAVLDKGMELNAKGVNQIKKKLETNLQRNIQRHKQDLQMDQDVPSSGEYEE